MAQRLPTLDALRSLAVLAVVGYHLVPVFGVGKINPVLTAILRAGYVGVDLFFVLSGFLIGRIILSELTATGGLKVGRFWWRRWMRTCPAYYAILFLIAGLDWVIVPDRPWGHFPAYLVYLQPYLAGTPLPRFGWSWSLCTEEFFYLAFPLLVLGGLVIAPRLSPAQVVRVLAVIIVIGSLGGRLATIYFGLDHPALVGAQLMMLPHNRLDGLAIGMWIATTEGINLPWKAWGAAIAGLLILALTAASVESSRNLDALRSLLFAVAFGLWVAPAVGATVLSRIAPPPSRWLAEHSYSLFLTHPIVIKFVSRIFPEHGTGFQLLVFTGGSLAATILLRQFVELPGLWMRDYLGRDRSGGKLTQLAEYPAKTP